MTRKTIMVGAQVEVPATNSSLNPLNGFALPSWPDVDTQQLFAPIDAAAFAAARAIALAPATDWDLVRVKLASGLAELLSPGRVLVLPPGDSVASFEPLIPIQATRLYNSQLQRTGAKPGALTNWVVTTDGNFNIKTTATGGELYGWTGSAWNDSGPIGANTIPFVPPSINLALNTSELSGRATDYSPDGVWSFADYAENGGLLFDDGTSAKGYAYVGSYLVGNLGTPGDLSAFSSIKFGFRWGNLTPLFYGRLAIDTWDGDCVDYPPRLPSQRQLVLPPISYAGSGQNIPTQVTLTVPAFNVQSIEWLVRNNGGGGGGGAHDDLYAQLVSPAAIDAFTTTDGVTTSDGTTTFGTIPAGQDGSIVLTDVRHPLVKLVIGSFGAVNLSASVLTLTRRFTH